MISEKKHPELARSLNSMTTILSKDHTEKEFKWALLHTLRAMAEIIVAEPRADEDINVIMGRIKDKYGPQRTFKDPNIHPCDGGKPCVHEFSRSMDQAYPRKCTKCGQTEPQGFRPGVERGTLLESETFCGDYYAQGKATS